MSEQLGKRLADQVAIVTGAGTGIGRSTALLLAAEGARVALSGRRREPLEEVGAKIREAGGEVVVIPGDVSKVQDVDALFRDVTTRWGRVDILVNNAATNVPRRNFAETSLEDWQQIVDINLSGSFYCARQALDVMRRQRSGTIVNVGSMAAKQAFLTSGVAYSASKAAQASLAQSINAEGRPFNVRACNIFPGEVNTPIIDRRPEVPSADVREKMLQPDDVAAAVVFVAALPQSVAVEEIQILPTHMRGAK